MVQVSKTLYVDIDSTIWPAEEHYDKAARELFGKSFPTNQWYDVSMLEEMYGLDYILIFRHALKPEEVANRKLYPYTKPALQKVVDANVGLHFITHNFEPFLFAEPLHDWLTSKLGLPVELTIYPENNPKVLTMLEDETAWGIVEDKSETIEHADAMGYTTFVKKQPWNAFTLQENLGIMGFDSWREFPALFAQALERANQREREVV